MEFFPLQFSLLTIFILYFADIIKNQLYFVKKNINLIICLRFSLMVLYDPIIIKFEIFSIYHFKCWMFLSIWFLKIVFQKCFTISPLWGAQKGVMLHKLDSEVFWEHVPGLWIFVGFQFRWNFELTWEKKHDTELRKCNFIYKFYKQHLEHSTLLIELKPIKITMCCFWYRALMKAEIRFFQMK